MNIHFLGIGSVGSLTAYHIRRALLAAASSPPPISSASTSPSTTYPPSISRDPPSTSQDAVKSIPRDTLTLHLRRRHSSHSQDQDVPVQPEDTCITLETPDGSTEQQCGFQVEYSEARDSKSDAQASKPEEVRAPSSRKENTIDILFVALKADQTITAIEPLLPRLMGWGSGRSETKKEEEGGKEDSPSTIVLLQNGVGQDEAILQRFYSATSPHPTSTSDSTFPTSNSSAKSRLLMPYILLGSNTHGTWRKSHLHVVHAAKGEMHFGLSRLSAARLATGAENNLLLNTTSHNSTNYREGGSSSLATLSHAYTLLAHPLLRSALATTLEPSREFQIRQLRKLVVNCALNPLTALYQCRNGALLETPERIAQVNQVVQECAPVIQARSTFHGETLSESLSEEQLRRHVHDVIRLTGANWSSMVQDVRDVKREGKTEVRYINGTVVNWGREVGVKTGVNEELVRRVEELGSERRGGV